MESNPALAAETATNTLPLNAYKDSASVMKSILSLHFPVGDIVDVNYSLGTFYKKVNRSVVGVDVRPLAMVQVQADNRNLPFADDSFSVGVCDPPYKRGIGDKKYFARYGVAPYTTKMTTRQYVELIPELLRVARDGMIIKAQDDTDGRRFHHRMFFLTAYVKELTGLDPHDIFYVVKSGVPENLVKGRVRHFSANCVSYFLVYRWARKRPYKPVRF